MTLAPEMVKQLNDLKAAGLPDIWEVPVAVTRGQSQARVAFNGPAEAIYKVENRFIPGPTADLPVRIYRPTTEKDAPALVYFHGGGWVLGFLDVYDAALHRLANQSGSVIISVNYQKAPEHPFPTPFDDCFATLQYVKNHAEEFGINANLIGVAGDSAGGNLAAAVALRARDEEISLAYQLLVYPCTALDFKSKSYIEYATEYGLTTRAMKWFWNQYLQGDENDQNSYAVPAAAYTFKELAPAIIITAQYDPLISDSEDYAEKLKSAGVDVTYREFPGMLHGFFATVAVTPSSPLAIDFCAQEIRKLVSN
jgi:acetyl esterase